MDASNNIRWNANISPLQSQPKRDVLGFDQSLKQQDDVAAELRGDQVSITPGQSASATPTAAPTAPLSATLSSIIERTPRESVPVSLLADDSTGSLVGGNPFFSSQSLSGLGVLSMIDDSVAAHEVGHTTALGGVRAIDNTGNVSAFKDLALIGPGNAAQYLADPSGMYLGM